MQLADIIKPHLRSRLKARDIPNFLPSKFDANTAHQANIWSTKTYKVNPRTHIFTTIQEHFGNRLIRSLKIPDGGVVVDIGCFIGEKLWQVRAKNYLGIGVDIALPALEAAQKIDIFGHKFIAADMEDLPFKDKSIDLVTVFDVIEHLTHAEKGFLEVSRILKPGGQFLLHIPIKDNEWSMFWWKQQLFPQAARKDYDDVGHAPSRMLTTTQISKHLLKYKLKKEKEIYYNSFFVHFFDRELFKLLALLSVKLFRSGKAKTNMRRTTHTGSLGITRAFYGKFVVPILELISWPDIILSKLKIGNTYFVLARKA